MKNYIIGLSIIVLTISGVVGWPYVYNYHIFSLAQLKNSIKVGDNYQDVLNKFKAYQTKHDNTGELQVVINNKKLLFKTLFTTKFFNIKKDVKKSGEFI